MKFQQLFKHAPITLLLITSFVGYAILQIFNGVNLDHPSNQELLAYGANFLPLTLAYEPWRMLSSGFLHIGLMHLLFNAFAIYYFGIVTEMIFGRWRFLTLFLFSVIGGNALNLVIGWQKVMDGNQPSITAGASGGIMGMGMALLILSISRLPVAKSLNRRSLAMVMAINILMGFALPGIDNAGHIGGAITGAIMASAFALSKHHHQRNFIVICAVLVVLFCATWWGLHQRLLAFIA